MSSDAKGAGALPGLVGGHDGHGLRIGIAAGRFNDRITRLLVDGAVSRLIQAGVEEDDVAIVWAPGAFELPLIAQALVDDGMDAVICLGAVIRGETSHYDFVAGQCAAGIQRVALDSDLPVIFGVLTTDNLDQALARAGGSHGHKGIEAAEASLEMVDLLRRIGSPETRDEQGPGGEGPGGESAGPRLYRA